MGVMVGAVVVGFICDKYVYMSFFSFLLFLIKHLHS